MARIQVRVQPGASKNEILGFTGDLLRIRLTSPPVDGKANEALIAFLAKVLRVRRNAIEILRGATSREKLIAIEGLNDAEARDRLRGIIAK